MGLLRLPRGDDGSSNRVSAEDDNRENDDEEQRLMSSSSRAAAAASRTSSSRKRSGVFQFAIFGCAFLFFALGYVSSPTTTTTPILSSQTSSSSSPSPSPLNSRRGASFSFPSLGSSSSQKSGRHRFELLLGGGKKREDEEEDRREAKETNALDAELELEKDEHLLVHLQKSLNDNIETQEKETLKLVKMKVDEQDAEKMQEEEELTEEELGIHHNNHGEDEESNTGSIDKSSSKNIKDDGSELGFKEEDNESGMKNATSRRKTTTTTTTFEDSLLTNVSSELDEVIRDGKQSMIEGRDVTPRSAAFESMDEELKDVLDAVHAVDGSGGENSENKRNNVKPAREKVLSSSSSSSSSFDRGDRKITTPKDNPEETLGWTEVDATTIDPESITESAQSGVRSLVLNPEIVHELKEKFEDMKNKGEVQVEGNWKKFDAEAKEEKKQMKEAKKMEAIVEESSKILDDIDAVRMAQSLDAGGGSKSFSWTFSYLYFPLIVFFSVLLAVIALLIKTSDKNKLKRYGSTGSFDRSSPKRKGKSRLYTLEEEEEIYQTTKDNTYPDFSNLRDFEKGNRIYNSSIESFDDDYEDDDYDDDSIDEEEDGSCEDDFDEEALSERSSDVSSFQGFREKAIAVAKAAEEFLANGKGATVRVSNAGTFHGASKYGANENGRDEKDDVGVTSLKKKESHNNNENGQKSSFIKSSTTKWI